MDRKKRKTSQVFDCAVFETETAKPLEEFAGPENSRIRRRQDETGTVKAGDAIVEPKERQCRRATEEDRGGEGGKSQTSGRGNLGNAAKCKLEKGSRRSAVDQAN